MVSIAISMFATDSGSERATSIEDYQNTCTEFIIDISHDYMDWIDRYQLGEDETDRRKSTINDIVKTTNDWIVKYGTTIKKVDIVMNDGVNKMAENTAGYPFDFDVIVNSISSFTIHPIGEIRVNIKATPRSGRRANWQLSERSIVADEFQSPVTFSISKESMTAADILNDYIIVDANQCHMHDLVSLTPVVEEIEEVMLQRVEDTLP